MKKDEDDERQKDPGSTLNQSENELPDRSLLRTNSIATGFEFPDVDGYVIELQLGEGAHGRVFKAIDMSLQKPVAIKVLKPIASKESHLRERFEREIKAYHSLKDGHVIQLRSHGGVSRGVYKDCPYVIMEFMDGGSYSDWLSRFPTDSIESLRVSVEILVEVCQGLAYLHEQGIVHRDLKPDNILLAELNETSDGQFRPRQVRLCDFGLIADLTESRELSRTGMGAGSPAYMSPEQFVDAKNITSASDQYAVGVMLYQLLCSRRPWQDSADVLEPQGLLEAKALSKTPCPPPSSSNSKIDGKLKEICLRCLEPNPLERYENVGHLRESLEAWLNGEIDPHCRNWFKRNYRTKVLHPIRRSPSKFVLAVASLAALMIMGYGAWNRWTYTTQLEAANDSLDAKNADLENAIQEKENALKAEELLRGHAISKDLAQRASQSIGEAGDPDDALGLAIRAVEVQNPPSPESLEMLAASLQANQSIGKFRNYRFDSWSPVDDRFILVRDFGLSINPMIKLCDASGDVLKSISLEPDRIGDRSLLSLHIEWSPNGQHFLVRDDLGEEERLTVFDRNGVKTGEIENFNRGWRSKTSTITWSPKGEHIAIITRHADGDFATVYRNTGVQIWDYSFADNSSWHFFDWENDESLLVFYTDGRLEKIGVNGNRELVTKVPDAARGQVVYLSDTSSFAYLTQGPSSRLLKFVSANGVNEVRTVRLDENFDRIHLSENERLLVLSNETSWQAFATYGQAVSQPVLFKHEDCTLKISPIGNALVVLADESSTADLYTLDGEHVAELKQFEGTLTIGQARNWPAKQRNGTGEKNLDCIWSPAGTHLVTIGPENTVLWDSDGFAICALDDGEKSAREIFFDPSGDRFVSMSTSSSIGVRAFDGSPKGVLRGIRSYSDSVWWSPSGELIAVRGKWNALDGDEVEGTRLFSASSGPSVLLSKHFQTNRRGVVAHLAWSPSENVIASGVRYLTRLQAYGTNYRPERRHSSSFGLFQESGEVISEIQTIEIRERVNSLTWSPDGSALALSVETDPFTEGDDVEYSVILLSSNGRRLKRIEDVKVFAWSPTDATLAVAARHEILLLDSKGRETQRFPVSAQVEGLLFSPNGEFLAVETVASTQQTMLLRFDSHDQLEQIRRIEGRSGTYSWSPDSRYFFIATVFGQYSGMDPYVGQIKNSKIFSSLRRISIDGSAEESTTELPTYCGELAVSPDGRYVACANVVNYDSPTPIYLWDCDDGTIDSHQFHVGVQHLAWCPKEANEIFASAGDDGKVCLWSPTEGLVGVADDENDRSAPVLNLAWSPDGNFLATADFHNSVRVWNANGRKVAAFDEGAGPFRIPTMKSKKLSSRQHTEILEQDFYHLAWSSDGRWIAVSNNRPEPRVFSFDFKSMYERSKQKLRIGKEVIDRGWNPSEDKWRLEEQVDQSNERYLLQAFFSQRKLSDVLTEVKELLHSKRTSEANTLVNRAINYWPKSSQLWHSRYKLDSAMGNFSGAAQSLATAISYGADSQENLREVAELYLTLGWNNKAFDAADDLNLEATSSQQVFLRALKAYLSEWLDDEGKIDESMDPKYFATLKKNKLSELKDALSSIASVDGIDPAIGRFHFVIEESIAQKFHDTRDFKSAARHHQIALTLLEDYRSKLKAPIFEKQDAVVDKVGKFQHFCEVVVRDSNEKQSSEKLPFISERRLLGLLRAYDSHDAKSLENAATAIIDSESQNPITLLRVAIVLSAFCKDSQPSEVTEIARLAVAALSKWKEISEEVPSYKQEELPNYFGLGTIGLDPAIAEERRVVAQIATRLEGKLSDGQCLELVESAGWELDHINEASLLLSVEKTNANRRALIARLMRVAYFLSEFSDYAPARNARLRIACRCFRRVRDLLRDADTDSREVRIYASLELGRLEFELGDYSTAMTEFGTTFGINTSNNENRFLSYVQSNPRFTGDDQSYLHYWLIWLRCLQHLDRRVEFERELAAFVETLQQRLSNESKYGLLEIYAEALLLKLTIVNDDSKSIDIWRSAAEVATRANKIVPTNSTLGGVPIPGFAGYANPLAYRHQALLEIAQISLKQGNLVAAQTLRDNVLHATVESNWNVSDYFKSYLNALHLRAYLILESSNHSHANGLVALNTSLRLCRNDGYSNPEFLEVLARSYARIGKYENAISVQQRVVSGSVEREAALSVLQQYREELARATTIQTDVPLPEVVQPGSFELVFEPNLVLCKYNEDRTGSRTSERYFDIAESPAVNSDGFHGWNREVVDGEEVTKYVGLDQKPIDTRLGYAMVRARLDEGGRRLSERYFDSRNAPAANQEGYHGWNREYDPNGHETVFYRVDTSGRPLLREDGYAYIRKRFDENGKVVGEAYFSPDGPTTTEQGFHAWSEIVDAKGGGERTYYGVDHDRFSVIGIMIVRVLEDSNAANSGLRAGDRFLEYNGEALHSLDQLKMLIKKSEDDEVDKKCNVRLKRGNTDLELEVFEGKLGAEIGKFYGLPSSTESKRDK